MDESFEVDDWVESSKDDLYSFDMDLKRKKYHNCLYHLQLSSEKIAKATLLNIPFSSKKSDSDLKELSNLIMEPRDYGHQWRKKFIEQIEKAINIPFFSPLVSSFLKETDVSDPQTTILNAKNVEDIKNPKSKDIDTVLNICNELLDQSENKTLDHEIAKKIHELIPIMNNQSKFAIDKDDIEKMIKTLIIYVHNIISLEALLILSTLLSPFYTNRYPSKSDIDVFIPKLKKIKETIERSIKIVENYKI